MIIEKSTKTSYARPSIKEYGNVSDLVGGGAQPGQANDGGFSYTS